MGRRTAPQTPGKTRMVYMNSSFQLSENQKQKLLNFLGYGNLNAPFWFMGMEEGSGGSVNLEPNITARLKFTDEIMDLQDAHNEKHLNWVYWDINNPVKFPSVWIYMARIMRALSSEKPEDWWDTEKAKQYIREKLGRSYEAGETFLTELLPLPKRKAFEWPALYEQSFGFKQRQDYEKQITPQRKDRIRTLLADEKPKYLFCYGETHYPHYKDVFPSENWRKLPETKFELASNDSTQVILSPFWGNGRVGYRQMKLLIEELNRH
jgi:hypothetical protein